MATGHRNMGPGQVNEARWVQWQPRGPHSTAPGRGSRVDIADLRK